MIAVTRESDNVWKVSLTEWEMEQVQGIAKAMNKDEKGVIAVLIAYALAEWIYITSNVQGNNESN